MSPKAASSRRFHATKREYITKDVNFYTKFYTKFKFMWNILKDLCLKTNVFRYKRSHRRKEAAWSTLLEGVGLAFLISILVFLISSIPLKDIDSFIARLAVPFRLQPFMSLIAMAVFALLLVAIILFMVLRRKRRRRRRRKRTKEKKKERKMKERSGARILARFFSRRVNIKKEYKKEQQEPKKPPLVHFKLGAYETGIDLLYRRIQQKGKITLEEVEKTFKVSKELAEEWAKILESHKLATIHYPAFSSPALTKYMPAQKEEDEK